MLEKELERKLRPLISLERARVALGFRGEDWERIAEAVRDFADLEIARNEDELLERFEDCDVLIRGNLSARRVLGELKDRLGVERIYRVALLVDARSRTFFLAPVGIDEGNDLESKLVFLRCFLEISRAFGIDPRVAILSGGRLEDRGRDPRVDETLDQATELEERARRMGLDAEHIGIVVEEALERGYEFLLAPDGISGNLIFRSLCLIGGGTAYGALTFGIDRIFVDTSRAQGIDGYIKAVRLGVAALNARLRTDL